MTRRTQTYVAGDWDGDNDAIQQLKSGMKSNVGVCPSMMFMRKPSHEIVARTAA